MSEQDHITINRWEAVSLDEWNGKYSIVSGFVGKEDEKFHHSKIKRRFGSQGEKEVPFRILIGESKEAAVATLERLLEMVTHNDPFNPRPRADSREERST